MMLNKTSPYLFLTDIGYENMINTMLKDLFKLLVACVAEPTEIISRVGCSCIRYQSINSVKIFKKHVFIISEELVD